MVTVETLVFVWPILIFAFAACAVLLLTRSSDRDRYEQRQHPAE